MRSRPFSSSRLHRRSREKRCPWNLPWRYVEGIARWIKRRRITACAITRARARGRSPTDFACVRPTKFDVPHISGPLATTVRPGMFPGIRPCTKGFSDSVRQRNYFNASRACRGNAHTGTGQVSPLRCISSLFPPVAEAARSTHRLSLNLDFARS